MFNDKEIRKYIKKCYKAVATKLHLDKMRQKSKRAQGKRKRARRERATPNAQYPI